jgi:quinol monooxygenase YgiN
MLIVGGDFQLDPEQREAFLASRVPAMEQSRAEPGCLEYTFAGDPVDPGRVILFERWESQEALDAHLKAMRSRPQPSTPAPAPRSASVKLYDVSAERSL